MRRVIRRTVAQTTTTTWTIAWEDDMPAPERGGDQTPIARSSEKVAIGPPPLRPAPRRRSKGPARRRWRRRE